MHVIRYIKYYSFTEEDNTEDFTKEESKAIMVHAIGVLFTTGATMAAAVLLSVK